MKCNGCGTAMVLERQESSPVSSSEWYNCPLCGKIRMTTRKTTAVQHSQHDASDVDNTELDFYAENPLVAG